MAHAKQPTLPVIVVASDGTEVGWRLSVESARGLVGKHPDAHEVRIQTPGPSPLELMRCEAGVWRVNTRNFRGYFGEPL